MIFSSCFALPSISLTFNNGQNNLFCSGISGYPPWFGFYVNMPMLSGGHHHHNHVLIIIFIIIIIIIYHPFIGSKMQIAPLECLLPSTNSDYDFILFEWPEAIMVGYCCNWTQGITSQYEVLLCMSMKEQTEKCCKWKSVSCREIVNLIYVQIEIFWTHCVTG